MSSNRSATKYSTCATRLFKPGKPLLWFSVWCIHSTRKPALRNLLDLRPHKQFRAPSTTRLRIYSVDALPSLCTIWQSRVQVPRFETFNPSMELDCSRRWTATLFSKISIRWTRTLMHLSRRRECTLYSVKMREKPTGSGYDFAARPQGPVPRCLPNGFAHPLLLHSRARASPYRRHFCRLCLPHWAVRRRFLGNRAQMMEFSFGIQSTRSTTYEKQLIASKFKSARKELLLLLNTGSCPKTFPPSPGIRQLHLACKAGRLMDAWIVCIG